MSEKEIPKATARRLPLYQTTFQTLLEFEKEKVSSAELSAMIKIDSTTIRRDFSYFGTLGRRGYGYDVKTMSEFLDRLLNAEDTINVAVVGVGNLGEALLKESFSYTNQIKVAVAFDVKDHLVNTTQNGIHIYNTEDIEELLPQFGIETVILTVPNARAQVVADQLARTSCRGILNFTNVRITVPNHIFVHNVNLGNEIKLLHYFMQNY